MSINDPKSPVSSPTPKSVRMDAPSTPPRHKRLSATFLQTPDLNYDQVPYSPSLKRTSSGSYKSPDDKLSSHNVASPAPGNILKTPRPSGYDSDDQIEPRKVPKTPQFFSPAKKLFNDDDQPPELAEISLQLRSRLSSAMGKLQQNKLSPTKVDLVDLSFTSTVSPSKKLKVNGRLAHSAPLLPQGSPTRHTDVSESVSQPTNLNLQTLQHSPVPRGTSSFPHSPQPGLKQSPQFADQERVINVPSPDEEASAHNALIAAISRQRRKSRTSFSSAEKRRLSSITEAPLGLKLPPINMPLKQDKKPINEQDAVYSLMSLLSPQSMKFGHSRSQSLNNNTTSTSSSRSSSVVSPQLSTVLPPISGLINTTSASASTGYNNDNDATDIENDSTDEDVSGPE